MRDVRIRGGFGKRDMGHTERACVAAEPRDPRQQVGMRRSGEQCGKQRVFLCTCKIDVLDRVGRWLSINIRAQTHPRDARCCLHGEHALCGNFVPVRNGWLRYSNTTGEFRDTANRLNRFA